MTFLTRYSHLKKKHDDRVKRPTKLPLAFTAVRAVGLAVELGHKLAKEQGLARTVAENLATITVTGPQLQVFVEGRWTDSRKCSLSLQPEDAKVARTILMMQRRFLADLQLNVWFVDLFNAATKKALDLVGDFSGSRNFGVLGRVWIELKTWSATGFERSLKDQRDYLPTVLSEVQKRDKSIGAVLLLCAKVQKHDKTWETPSLIAMLYAHTWQDISSCGKRKAPAGTVKAAQKPSLQEIWSGMEWHIVPAGPPVGLLVQFLSGLGLSDGNPGKRAGSFNRKLRLAGNPSRIKQVEFPNKPGSQPWCATRSTLRMIYNTL
jgi:hypothetical protein